MFYIFWPRKLEDNVTVIFVLLGFMFLLLVAMATLHCRSWQMTKEQKPEQAHIDKVREAAFAVIEASLEAEPEKWKVQSATGGKSKPVWLINEEAGLALWLYDGPANLYVLRRRNTANNFTIANGEKLEVSSPMNHALWSASMKIVNEIVVKREIRTLQNMVSAFGVVVDRSKSNDQEAA